MKVRLRQLSVASIALLSVAACAPPYQLLVRNVDGPDVVLVINGQPVADVPCNAGPIEITPGVNAPSLPWRLVLQRANGDVFAAWDVDGARGPRQELVIRDIGAIEIPPADPADAAFTALPCAAP